MRLGLTASSADEKKRSEVFPAQVPIETLRINDVCGVCLSHFVENTTTEIDYSPLPKSCIGEGINFYPHRPPLATSQTQLRIALLSDCAHTFHVGCIKNWIARQPATCPVCHVPFRSVGEYLNDGSRVFCQLSVSPSAYDMISKTISQSDDVQGSGYDGNRKHGDPALIRSLRDLALKLKNSKNPGSASDGNQHLAHSSSLGSVEPDASEPSSSSSSDSSDDDSGEDSSDLLSIDSHESDSSSSDTSSSSSADDDKLVLRNKVKKSRLNGKTVSQLSEIRDLDVRTKYSQPFNGELQRLSPALPLPEGSDAGKTSYREKPMFGRRSALDSGDYSSTSHSGCSHRGDLQAKNNGEIAASTDSTVSTKSWKLEQGNFFEATSFTNLSKSSSATFHPDARGSGIIRAVLPHSSNLTGAGSQDYPCEKSRKSVTAIAGAPMMAEECSAQSFSGRVSMKNASGKPSAGSSILPGIKQSHSGSFSNNMSFNSSRTSRAKSTSNQKANRSFTGKTTGTEKRFGAPLNEQEAKNPVPSRGNLSSLQPLNRMSKVRQRKLLDNTYETKSSVNRTEDYKQKGFRPFGGDFDGWAGHRFTVVPVRKEAAPSTDSLPNAGSQKKKKYRGLTRFMADVSSDSLFGVGNNELGVEIPMSSGTLLNHVDRESKQVSSTTQSHNRSNNSLKEETADEVSLSLPIERNELVNYQNDSLGPENPISALSAKNTLPARNDRSTAAGDPNNASPCKDLRSDVKDETKSHVATRSSSSSVPEISVSANGGTLQSETMTSEIENSVSNSSNYFSDSPNSSSVHPSESLQFRTTACSPLDHLPDESKEVMEFNFSSLEEADKSQSNNLNLNLREGGDQEAVELPSRTTGTSKRLNRRGERAKSQVSRKKRDIAGRKSSTDNFTCPDSSVSSCGKHQDTSCETKDSSSFQFSSRTFDSGDEECCKRSRKVLKNTSDQQEGLDSLAASSATSPSSSVHCGAKETLEDFNSHAHLIAGASSCVPVCSSKDEYASSAPVLESPQQILSRAKYLPSSTIASMRDVLTTFMKSPSSSEYLPEEFSAFDKAKLVTAFLNFLHGLAATSTLSKITSTSNFLNNDD